MKKSVEEKFEKMVAKNSSKMGKSTTRISRPTTIVAVLVALAIIVVIFGRFSGNISLKLPNPGNLIPQGSVANPQDTGILLKNAQVITAEGNSTAHEFEKIIFSVDVEVTGQSKVSEVYFILTKPNTTNRNYLWGNASGGNFTTGLTFFTGNYEATFYANDQFGNQADPIKASFHITPLFFGSSHTSLISGGPGPINNLGNPGNEGNGTPSGNGNSGGNSGNGNGNGNSGGSSGNGNSGSGSGNGNTGSGSGNGGTGNGGNSGSGNQGNGNHGNGSSSNGHGEENESDDSGSEHSNEIKVVCSPKAVNEQSNGKWINCKIKSDSDVISATLNGVTPEVMRDNGNGVHLKFDRGDVVQTLSQGSYHLSIVLDSGTENMTIPVKSK